MMNFDNYYKFKMKRRECLFIYTVEFLIKFLIWFFIVCFKINFDKHLFERKRGKGN